MSPVQARRDSVPAANDFDIGSEHLRAALLARTYRHSVSLDSSHTTAHASPPPSINRRKVANRTPGVQDDREWARRRSLLRAVLRYLTENGPTHWATIYIHFDHGGTEEIGKALGHLAVCKHVAIEGSTAKITALGMEQLKSRK
jgi:hypothetical protein